MQVIEFMAKQIENKNVYCCSSPPLSNVIEDSKREEIATADDLHGSSDLRYSVDTFRVHKHKDVNGKRSKK